MFGGFAEGKTEKQYGDNAIYMEFEDYISSFGNDFYNPQKRIIT